MPLSIRRRPQSGEPQTIPPEAPGPGPASRRQRPGRGRRRLGIALLGAVLLVSGAWFLPGPADSLLEAVERTDLTAPLRPLGTSELALRFPEVLPLDWPVPETLQVGKLTMYTTIDTRLQDEMQAYLEAQRPHYAAAVALDPLTGGILAIASYSSHSAWRDRNLGLAAGFPAASIFKLVTAAGALAEGRRGRLDPIQFVGSRTARPADWNTKTTINPKGNWITLEEAFAGSVNPVFGTLGAFDLGRDGVLQWGQLFGWDAPLTDQLRVAESRMRLADDPIATAQVGAGYTQATTLSPLHGAALAATVVNGGTFIRPGIIDAIVDAEGRVRYSRPVLDGERLFSAGVADELLLMMEATVVYGTARRPYDQRSGVLNHLIVGGKTGTLTGTDPAGRNLWFVGWAWDTVAREPLAFATLVVDPGGARMNAKDLSKRLLTTYFERHRERTASNVEYAFARREAVLPEPLAKPGRRPGRPAAAAQVDSSAQDGAAEATAAAKPKPRAAAGKRRATSAKTPPARKPSTRQSTTRKKPGS
jgi:penicillin-binding protein A